MSRFDSQRDIACSGIGVDNYGSLTVVFQDTKAMGDAVEALENRVKSLKETVRGARAAGDGLASHCDVKFAALDSRLTSLAERVEQREGRAGVPRRGYKHIVQWQVDDPRAIALLMYGSHGQLEWYREERAGTWSFSDTPPAHVGPRVDLGGEG